MTTLCKLKSVALVAATVILCVIFVAGVVIRIHGPVKIGSHLSVTSEHGHWLVFFESPLPEPLFNGVWGIYVGGYIAVNGYRTHEREDIRWVLAGDDACFVRRRYVDDTGTTRYLTTDFRMPGIFYMNDRSPDYRVLTFALRWWFALGLPALFPGLCVASRVRNKLRGPNKTLHATAAAPGS